MLSTKICDGYSVTFLNGTLIIWVVCGLVRIKQFTPHPLLHCMFANAPQVLLCSNTELVEEEAYRPFPKCRPMLRSRHLTGLGVRVTLVFVDTSIGNSWRTWTTNQITPNWYICVTLDIHNLLISNSMNQLTLWYIICTTATLPFVSDYSLDSTFQLQLVTDEPVEFKK